MKEIKINQRLEGAKTRQEQDFMQIVAESVRAMEVLPGTLYDTLTYHSETTIELRFFNELKPHPALSNMDLRGILPAPNIFLIESIRIYGIQTALRFGACRLQIGNKHWGVNPAWTYGLKEKGYKLNPQILIPQLTTFDFVIKWDEPKQLCHGLDDQPVYKTQIQVVFMGKRARAIQ